MAYIAQRFCRFAGKEFRIGEHIPAELIDAKAIRRLKESGKIAEVAEGPLLPSAPSSDADDADEEDEVIDKDADDGEYKDEECIFITEDGHIEAESLYDIDYNDLKKMAKDMGLNAKGTKNELIERIAKAQVMVPEEA